MCASDLIGNLHVAEQSEIEVFASWFDQEFDERLNEFMVEVKNYIDSLSLRRRRELIEQLEGFIEKNENKTYDEVYYEMFLLGARYWNKKYDIIDTLRYCVKLLHGPPRENASDIKGMV